METRKIKLDGINEIFEANDVFCSGVVAEEILDAIEGVDDHSDPRYQTLGQKHECDKCKELQSQIDSLKNEVSIYNHHVCGSNKVATIVNGRISLEWRR